MPHVVQPSPSSPAGRAAPSIAILGAGAAGLCMGIRLRQAGIEAFTIYEKSDRVGGTWRDNTYPASGCDVPSHLYSYSFEPKLDWSRVFSLQPEIEDYFEHCAEKYGLLPHIRFGVEIASARFDEAAGVWRLRTTAGDEITAAVVVSGLGQLNRPHLPAVPGLDQFGGDWFHSARWNHARDLRDREVAVVGNGASALQLIPQVARVARRLRIFQRSANWIIPRNDRPYSAWEQWAFRHVPGYAPLIRAWIYWQLELRFFAFSAGSRIARQLERQAIAYMESHVADPRLRKILTPDYPIGAKRILISDDYFQAITRPNVEIVTEPIARVARDGLVTADGALHPADTIVFATGFESTSFLAPIDVQGLGGRRLADDWKDGAEAYYGIAVSGFPNLFLLYGPNTNLGHNSIIFMIECQVHYVMQLVERLRRERLAWLDVRPEVQADYNVLLQRKLARTAWNADCRSWYKTETGKITNNWSGFTVEYWWETRQPEESAFTAMPAARTSAQSAAA